VTVPRYYLSRRHPRVSVCWTCVCFLRCRGEQTRRFESAAAELILTSVPGDFQKVKLSTVATGAGHKEPMTRLIHRVELASVCQTDHQHTNKCERDWGSGFVFQRRIFFFLRVCSFPPPPVQRIRPGRRGLACLTEAKTSATEHSQPVLLLLF